VQVASNRLKKEDVFNNTIIISKEILNQSNVQSKHVPFPPFPQIVALASHMMVGNLFVILTS
jgi:hypothetical protein